MNSKLLIFVLVVVGFKSISSSIIKHELVDDESFVKIDDFNYLNIANNQEIGLDDKSPFDNIKELTFNISKNVKIGGDIVSSEIVCNNSSPKYDMCAIGNGKYQARFVTCKNVNYGTGNRQEFLCKHTGHRVTNKNLVQKYQAISCGEVTTPESAKGKCVYQYSYAKLPGFTEDDDVKHE